MTSSFNVKALEVDGDVNVEYNITYIKEYLNENNSSVENELNKVILEFKESGLDELIETLEESLINYENYKVEVNGVEEEIETYSIFKNLVYKAAVSAAIASFNFWVINYLPNY